MFDPDSPTGRRPPTSVHEIKSGDPWEFSNGRAIYCVPTGAPGAKGAELGSQVIGSDPMVKAVGVDAGFSPHPLMLRAPDVSIVPEEETTGFIQGVPPLAIEYADRGQDEAELRSKIQEFLSLGTQFIWVVRLVGPRRVEVFEPGKVERTYGPGKLLEAPGILKNPVPVEALYDRKVAQEVTLRNLLQRKGYQSLEKLWEEAHQEGLNQGIEHGAQQAQAHNLEIAAQAFFETAAAREFRLSDEQRQRVKACCDLSTLIRWNMRAVTCSSAEAIFEGN